MKLTDEPEDSLKFESISNNAFDKKGVLFALGSDFGKSAYTNPADSGKVRFNWSHDAANFYSTECHKEGDAALAAHSICSNAHEGKDDTVY